MYNSLVVRNLAKLWSFFTLNYESSYLRKCVDGFNKFVSFLFKGSIIKYILVSEDSYIKKTLFYKAYSKIIDFFSNILERLNSSTKIIKENSFCCRMIKIIYVKFKETSKIINLENALKGSWLFIFIRDLFSADEEGDRWW